MSGTPATLQTALAGPVSAQRPGAVKHGGKQASRSATLRTSEIRYRRLFDEAREGILLVDPGTHRITDANPFMTDLLGCSHLELVGKKLCEIGLLKDEEASRAAFRELKDQHFVRYDDLTLSDKSGRRHEVEFVSNLYDEDGQSVIQCNIRDITEHKKAEKELAKARRTIARHAARMEVAVAESGALLRETIGELEAFSCSVSHDMRGPLRAMQSYASLVLNEYGDRLDEQGHKNLRQIMSSCVRLDRLVQDVLNYTTILHSPVPVVQIDLDRLVRDIVESNRDGQPGSSGIQIHGRLPRVIGNEALLTQCISNLISNGIKFVTPGTVPHLDISATATDALTVRLNFKDNGVGIAPENHKRIFRMFERVHSPSVYEGTGIGLAIVRKAIERMDARVGLGSAPGQGATFWLELKTGKQPHPNGGASCQPPAQSRTHK